MPALLDDQGVHRPIKSVSGTSLPALSVIHSVFTFTPLSLVLDTVSFGLTYFAASGSPTLADVNDLGVKLITSLGAIATGATSSPFQYQRQIFGTTTAYGALNQYDVSAHLDGTPHGSPVNVIGFVPTSAGSASAVPDGCCAVVTLQAPYGSDPEFSPGPPPHQRPRARDRGRIYFGPLSINALAVESTTNRTTVAPQTRTDLVKWIHSIATVVSIAGQIWDLGVWSRAAAGVKGVIETWVDDRPDYQRRRADQGTVRTSQSIP